MPMIETRFFSNHARSRCESSSSDALAIVKGERGGKLRSSSAIHSRVSTIAAVTLVLTACSDSKDSAPEPSIEPRLSVIDMRIFQPSCTFSSCHGGDDPRQGLSLLEDPHAALVNRPSTAVPSRMLVVPGSPTESYLLEKLTSNVPASGARMPYAASPLSDQKITAIRTWIEQGAQNN